MFVTSRAARTTVTTVDRQRARAFGASSIVALLIAALALLYLPATASAVIVRPFECKVKPATIVGTEQDDVLQGTAKDDVIVGLGGNDRVTGAGGQDRICGGAGDDILDGGPGDDKLSGEADNDTLLGEGGWDDVLGEEGNDTLVEPADDRGTNALSGGPGIDDIEGGRGDDGIDGGDGGDKIKAGGGNDDVDGEDGDDDIDGGPGNDDIDGGDGTDVIKGAGAGDNQLRGGDGDDIIDAGPGDDRSVSGGDGNDVLDGVGGDDRLLGLNGIDRLEGGPGKDEMLGGAGADNCGGGPQRDRCDGGAPSPSNRDADPDVCAKDVEKKVDCREGDEYPVAWTGTAVGTKGDVRVDYNGLVFERMPPREDPDVGLYYGLVAGTWEISGRSGDCTVSGSGQLLTASPEPDGDNQLRGGEDAGVEPSRLEIHPKGTIDPNTYEFYLVPEPSAVTVSCPEETYAEGFGHEVGSGGPWEPETTHLGGSGAGQSEIWVAELSWSFTASP